MESAHLLPQLFTCQDAVINNSPKYFVLNYINDQHIKLYRFQNFKCEIHAGNKEHLTLRKTQNHTNLSTLEEQFYENNQNIPQIKFFPQ